jgi:hypothetical protein
MVPEADGPTLRIAAAYADLLAAQGEQDRAADWAAALGQVDPEGLLGIGEGPQVTFLEEEFEEPDGDHEDDEPTRSSEQDGAAGEASVEVETAVPGGFAADVEAEVAELLGETGGHAEEGGDAEDGGGSGASEH